jgi:hypothetical protein
MRPALLTLAGLAVFMVTVSWLYYAIAIALWVFVFGDDSMTFGYYALAIAVPLALLLSGAFVGATVRWSVASNVLTAVIVVAALLEVLFVIAIRS